MQEHILIILDQENVSPGIKIILIVIRDIICCDKSLYACGVIGFARTEEISVREIYVREVIERGLADSKAGRTKDVKDIRAKYGLPE